jgi:alpha-tubulin suppressor-like RCC1 family protein
MIVCKLLGWDDNFRFDLSNSSQNLRASPGNLSFLVSFDEFIFLTSDGEVIIYPRKVKNGSEMNFNYLSFCNILGGTASNQKVRDIAFTKRSLIYVDADGCVHSWVRNKHSDEPDELASPTSRTILPRKIAQKMAVRQLAAGDSHVLVLVTDKSLFSWGSGRNGELGVGTRIDFQESVREVTLPDATEQVQYIACGGNFSAVISYPSNWVYTFGCGAYYRLGTGSDEDCLSPTKVVELDGVGVMKADGRFSGVKLVSCGTWHAVAVAADTNDVYSWGWNKFGQCGTADQNVGADPHSRGGMSISHSDEIVATPRRISELDADSLVGSGEYEFDSKSDYAGGRDDGKYEITAVTCGSRHTALLTRNRRRVIVM